MNFLEKKDVFIKTSKTILSENSERIEKIKKLCRYIQIEEGLSDEDKALLKHIDKQLIYLANKTVKALNLTLKGIFPEKNITFKVLKNSSLEISEGIIKIHGYESESPPSEESKIENLPDFIDLKENIILVLDIFHEIRVLPWRDK